MKYVVLCITFILAAMSAPVFAAKSRDTCELVYDGTKHVVSAVIKDKAAWAVNPHRHDKMYPREPNEAFQLSLRDVLQRMEAIKLPPADQVTVLWYIVTEYENGLVGETAEVRADNARNTCATIEN